MRKALFLLSIVLMFILVSPICVHAQFKWDWNNKRDADLGLSFQLGRVFEFGGYCALMNSYLSISDREKYQIWRETPTKYWSQLHEVYEKGFENAKREMERK